MSETASTAANRTLRRLPNAAYRPREYLTEAEVERLIEAARKRGRNGLRDKGGQESVHPLHGPELRALRPLQGHSPYVFVTEAGTSNSDCWGHFFLRRRSPHGYTEKTDALALPTSVQVERPRTSYSRFQSEAIG